MKKLIEMARLKNKHLLVERSTFIADKKKIKLAENIEYGDLKKDFTAEKYLSYKDKDYPILAVVERVPISRYDHVNLNERIYPRKLWENVKKSGVYENTFMLADHPKDDEGVGSTTRIVGIWKGLEIDDNDKVVYSNLYIINEGYGRLLLKVLEAGGKVGLSTVGFGTFLTDQKTVDPDSYELVRLADWVLDPSQEVYVELPEEYIYTSNNGKTYSNKWNVIKENYDFAINKDMEKEKSTKKLLEEFYEASKTGSIEKMFKLYEEIVENYIKAPEEKKMKYEMLMEQASVIINDKIKSEKNEDKKETITKGVEKILENKLNSVKDKITEKLKNIKINDNLISNEEKQSLLHNKKVDLEKLEEKIQKYVLNESIKASNDIKKKYEILNKKYRELFSEKVKNKDLLKEKQLLIKKYKSLYESLDSKIAKLLKKQNELLIEKEQLMRENKEYKEKLEELMKRQKEIERERNLYEKQYKTLKKDYNKILKQNLTESIKENITKEDSDMIKKRTLTNKRELREEIDWDPREPKYDKWKNKTYSQAVDYAKHIQDEYYSKSSNSKTDMKEKIRRYYYQKVKDYPMLKQIREEIFSAKSLGEAIRLTREFTLNKENEMSLMKEDSQRGVLGVFNDQGQNFFHNKKTQASDDDWLEGRL
jgi:hypothetical protein